MSSRFLASFATISAIFFTALALVTPEDFSQAQGLEDSQPRSPQEPYQVDTTFTATDYLRDQDWATCEAFVSGLYGFIVDLNMNYQLVCNTGPFTPYTEIGDHAADHVLELQTVDMAFQLSPAYKFSDYSNAIQLSVLKILNGRRNMRYLPRKINTRKGLIVSALLTGMELPPARTIPKCPEVKVTSAEELTKVKLWVGEFEEVTDQIALEVNELLQHPTHIVPGAAFPPIQRVNDVITYCIKNLKFKPPQVTHV